MRRPHADAQRSGRDVPPRGLEQVGVGVVVLHVTVQHQIVTGAQEVDRRRADLDQRLVAGGKPTQIDNACPLVADRDVELDHAIVRCVRVAGQIDPAASPERIQHRAR